MSSFGSIWAKKTKMKCQAQLLQSWGFNTSVMMPASAVCVFLRILSSPLEAAAEFPPPLVTPPKLAWLKQSLLWFRVTTSITSGSIMKHKA